MHDRGRLAVRQAGGWLAAPPDPIARYCFVSSSRPIGQCAGVRRSRPSPRYPECRGIGGFELAGGHGQAFLGHLLYIAAIVSARAAILAQAPLRPAEPEFWVTCAALALLFLVCDSTRSCSATASGRGHLARPRRSRPSCCS